MLAPTLLVVAAALAVPPRPDAPGPAPAAPPAERAAADLPEDPARLIEMISRAASLDEAIAIRARLIEVAGSGDERAPTWMVEQAAAILDRLARDGSEASVILGLATPAQRAAAQAGAEEMLALAARADDAATRAVERLQARIMDSRGDAEAVRQRARAAERSLAQLIDVEQAVRIPYFRGRAAVILAALERERAPRQEFVRVALESLGRLRLGTAAAEASRRISLAATLLMLAEHDPAFAATGGAAPEPVVQAADLARWVVEQPARDEAGGAPDPLTRAQAWMVLLRSARTREQLRGAREALALAAITEPFVVGEGERRAADPLLALLAAEASTRAGLALAPTGARSPAAHLDEAFAPMVALLVRDDLAPHRAALRPVVLAKIGAATDGLMPLAEMDPAVALARAITLARSSRPGGPGRAEAAALLVSVADREGAHDEVRADALWELAVLRWEQGQTPAAVDAVAALVRLASELPRSPRAADAARKAVELGRYTLAQLGQGASAEEAGLRERLAGLYARALELAVTHAPASPESAENRLERARLALEQAAPDGRSAGPAAATPEELDQALDALEGVPPGDARAAEADRLAREAIERALAAAAAAVERAAAAEPPGSVTGTLLGPARERQVAVARRAVQWASARRPSEADRYRLILADALLASGDARAGGIYEDIAARAPATGDLGAAARLGLGRAQRAAGSAEAAFATLRSLTDDLERAAQARTPGSRERPPQYWLAWAEMLEILAADNRDGRRTDTIRLQLNRLALVDPAFGGGPARDRLEAVRAGLR